MALLGKVVDSCFGAVAGFVTAIISSPFLGAWRTYQMTETRGWTFRYAFSLATFVPRLFLNTLLFGFMGTVGGVVHGVRAGFVAGCLWPKRLMNVLNAPLGMNLFTRVFSAPASISPPLIIPPTLPTLPFNLSPIEEEEEEEKLEEKKDEDQEANLDPEKQATYTFKGRVEQWTAGQLRGLSRTLQRGKYKILSFWNNQLNRLTPECITALMESIQQSEIEVLYLNNNNIGQWNAEQLNAFIQGLIKAKKLKTLYLSSNNLNASLDAFTSLIQAIVQTNIETLDLSNNNLSTFSYDQMTSSLACLTRSNIIALFLDNNNLGQWSIKQLIDFMVGLKLQHIDLASNNMQNATNQWTEAHIKVFLKTLNFMSYINLEKNNFSNDQQAIFNAGTEKNISAQRNAFLMGTKPHPDRFNEEKATITPPDIYASFFNAPLGQNGAVQLTREIFEFLPQLTTGF